MTDREPVRARTGPQRWPPPRARRPRRPPRPPPRAERARRGAPPRARSSAWVATRPSAAGATRGAPRASTAALRPRLERHATHMTTSTTGCRAVWCAPRAGADLPARVARRTRQRVRPTRPPLPPCAAARATPPPGSRNGLHRTRSARAPRRATPRRRPWGGDLASTPVRARAPGADSAPPPPPPPAPCTPPLPTAARVTSSTR